MKAKTRKTLRNIHRWFGLIGGLWIIVLGFSGLMLDHRDDWGWAWRLQISDRMLPYHTAEVLKNRHITLAQANPENPEEWIVGGPLGVWQSTDGTQTWQAVSFEGLSVSPMVFSITLDQVEGWSKIWLASDDGIWSYRPNAPTIMREGLKGQYITALDNGAVSGTLVAVENKSDILTWSKQQPSTFRRLDLSQSKVSGLPVKVSLSRFLFDMHLGRSFAYRPFNIAMNDFGAIAMIILAFSGFLRWFYMRRWRGTRGPKQETKRSLFNGLYNFHAPIIGILAIVPLIYLSFTGIIFNHRFEWMGPLVKTKVERSMLPPVYDFNSLDREISHIVAYPDKAEKFTIGTRLGVLTSNDAGQSWSRETGTPVTPGFVWSLKRHGDDLFLGGLGGPSFIRNLDGEDWAMVPGLMGMPSDATVSTDGWHVISGPNMFFGDIRGGVTSAPFNLPVMNTKPFMLVMFELHNGNIIGKWFRYVLDIMALFLIFMTITGPILWWRRKWAK